MISITFNRPNAKGESEIVVRPRFSTEIGPFELDLPAGRKIGGVIAEDLKPGGDLLVLHQSSAPGREVPGLDLSMFLPDVVRFTAEGRFIDAWGGAGHLPPVDGMEQWPIGREGIECDDEGNIWIFGYSTNDDVNFGRVFGILHRFRAMPNGDLLLCCAGAGLKRLKYLGTH